MSNQITFKTKAETMKLYQSLELTTNISDVRCVPFQLSLSLNSFLLSVLRLSNFCKHAKKIHRFQCGISQRPHCVKLKLKQTLFIFQRSESYSYDIYSFLTNSQDQWYFTSFFYSLIKDGTKFLSHAVCPPIHFFFKKRVCVGVIMRKKLIILTNFKIKDFKSFRE